MSQYSMFYYFNFVSLSHCDFVLKIFLCVFASLRLCEASRGIALSFAATMAAAMHIFRAVAFSLKSAANAPFQRHQPSQPPDKNANSAPCSLTSASHFGGKYA